MNFFEKITLRGGGAQQWITALLMFFTSDSKNENIP